MPSHLFGNLAVRFLAILVFFTAHSIFAQSRRVQPTPTPTPDDTVRIHTEEIKLNVLAFDENGQFFRDVTADDLVITENNILHQPASVRRLPANVLIVMDTGGELRFVKSLDKTRAVATGLVNALRSGDSVAILQYSDKAEVVGEWTDDKAAALAAIKRTTFGRRSLFVDALKLATDFLLRSGLDNKHLVLITDGTDSLGRSSARFEAMQRLVATDVSVHVLSYSSMEATSIEPRTKSTTTLPPRPAIPEEVARQMPQGDINATRVKVGPTINTDRRMLRTMRSRRSDLEVAQQQLEKLADETNGEFILPDSTDEMADKAALVARMIDAAYAVTYTPKIPVTETRGVAERNIQVTSKRDGLTVQARRKLVFRAQK
jgi:VWFA-related protein